MSGSQRNLTPEKLEPMGVAHLSLLTVQGLEEPRRSRARLLWRTSRPSRGEKQSMWSLPRGCLPTGHSFLQALAVLLNCAGAWDLDF